MSYQSGTHIIASLTTNATNLLNGFENFKTLVDDLITKYKLNNLGEVYHNFSPAGFTAVVCLSESHLSVHTWPETGKVNLDIYLSNYERTNDQTVAGIYEAMVKYFDAVVDQTQTIYR
ncbi:MAG: S-adenosylmethionine decarboxylase [Ferruginibacter sp.]